MKLNNEFYFVINVKYFMFKHEHQSMKVFFKEKLEFLWFGNVFL